MAELDWILVRYDNNKILEKPNNLRYSYETAINLL